MAYVRASPQLAPILVITALSALLALGLAADLPGPAWTAPPGADVPDGYSYHPWHALAQADQLESRDTCRDPPTSTTPGAVVEITLADNITDGAGSPELLGANYITLFERDGRLYAAVASFDDNGVQILDLTDPDNITGAGSIANGPGLMLYRPWGITTFERNGHTYAAVTAQEGDGVQILDLTDPDNITGAGSIANGPGLALNRPRGITTFEQDDRLYAVVVANTDNGVQILDLTDLDNIIGVDYITSRSDGAKLEYAIDVVTFERDGRLYAAITAAHDDSVQILDLTDPGNVTKTDHITYDDERHPWLYGAWSIDTFERDGRLYAAVTANTGNSIHILDLTDPDNVTGLGHITDDADLLLEHIWGIDTFDVDGNTYAAVAGPVENGVHIFNLTDPTNITAVDSIADNGTGALEFPTIITTFHVDGLPYAAVTTTDGVQILRLASPPTTQAGTDQVVLGDQTAQDYAAAAPGRHLIEDSLESHTDVGGYRFEVTDAGEPVEVVLSWTTDPLYDYCDSNPSGKRYFAELGFTVDCPGMETVSAQSAYQANEFAVFTPVQAGACTVAVTGSNIDAPRYPQQDYAIASTLPLEAVDIQRPTPKISSVQPSPTNARDITFMVDFGEPVDTTTLNVSNISASSGTVSGILSDNGTARSLTFNVLEPAAGNLTVSIPEGSVLDPAGNNNTASNLYVIEVDRIRPAPTLSTTASSPVSASAITFMVYFDEPVGAATFNASDVSASSGTVSGILPASGITREITFDISELAAGNLTVSVPEGGVLDPAGNNNTASNLYVIEVERPRPSPSISTAEPSPTNARDIAFAVNFGELVDAGTFAASDVSASSGTVSDILPASGISREFTFEVVGPAAGNLTVAIPEGGVTDPSGNSNTASEPLVIEVERTRPAPTLSTTASSPVSESAITVMVDFGEPVDAGTFELSDILATGRTVSGILPASGTTARSFTFEVSELGTGTVIVSIPEGGVLDPAGNNNTASNMLTLNVTGSPDGVPAAAAPFVTTWETTEPNERIIIPVRGDGTYTVHWGDGSVDAGVGGTKMHRYEEAGTYTVRIYGDFPGIYLAETPRHAHMLQSIERWGDIRWKSMGGAFSYSSNMVYRATDSPDLSAVTDMSGMFWTASRFNGDISSWDVSSVTDMSLMFLGTGSFDRNLGKWYIVLDDTAISDAGETLRISAQNAYLNGQNPAYAVDGTAPNGDKFWIVNASHLAVRDDQTVVPGQYNVTIKSTGSFGKDNSRMVEITVGNDTIHHTNNPPSVDAGSGQAAVEGTTVTLAGNATDPDGNSMTYLWTHDSALDIALANATSPSATFTAPQVDSDTPVEFTLTVSDGEATVTDTATVTITDSANTAPSVSAGQDQTAVEGSAVSLNGTASDADLEDTLTYTWSHNSTLAITVADVEDPSFTAPNVAGITPVEFTLGVFDGTATVTDTVIITITDSANAAPAVDAGDDREYAEGSTISLNGTVTDPDTEDALTYTWSHNSTLAITVADVEDPSFTAPNVAGITPVEFTLGVFDGTATVTDTVIITITDSANAAPAVDAGDDREYAEGSTISLNGTVTDPDTEDALTYTWSHNSTLAITVADVEDPSFTAPNVAGITPVEFTLGVFDGTATVTDTVIITITDSANAAPAVDAGDDREYAEGSTISLNGTVTDPDTEDALTYTWSHNSTLAITVADVEDPSFTAPNVAGITPVEFTLGVFDGTATVTDTVIITITDSANAAPAVDAGDDREYAEGSTISLNGTVTDPDTEDALTYTWSHNSTLAITVADVEDPSFTAPNVAGITPVEFTLGVFDGTTTVTDTVIITITDSANAAPAVDAGDDREYAEGSTISLNGTVTDPDTEDALTYTWSHNSTLAITVADVEDPSFTAPNVAGITPVEFTLGVFDGTTTVTDTVIITITDSANAAPSVDAGPAQTVAEGSTVDMDGTVTDLDTEDALTYTWSHNSTLAITVADVEDPSFTAPNVAGITPVEFTLGVFDGTTTVTDTVIITITDSANAAPSVDAGPAQTVAEGSTVDMDGTVTDLDTEDALTYTWSHNSTLAITITDVEDPSFTAPNVDSDTPVEFTLTVSDGAASASDTATVTVTDTPAEVVQQISSVVLEPEGSLASRDIGRIVLNNSTPGTIDASWAAPSENPVDYRISWALAGNPYLTWTDLTGNAFPTGASHTISNLEEGETYKVKVRARYAGTAGDWSGEIVIAVAVSTNNPPTVDAGQPQTVSEGDVVALAGTATYQGDDTLTYIWTHDSSLPITITNATLPSTTFAAPDVNSNTTITFTLTVSDDAQTASDSVDITITDTPPVDPEDMPAESIQSATAVLDAPAPLGPRDIGRITLSSSQPGTIEAAWEAPSEAPRDYRISWAKAGEPFRTWTDLSGNAFPTVPTQTIPDLEEGETYKVIVRARYHDDAPGDWSGEITITVASSR